MPINGLACVFKQVYGEHLTSNNHLPGNGFLRHSNFVANVTPQCTSSSNCSSNVRERSNLVLVLTQRHLLSVSPLWRKCPCSDMVRLGMHLAENHNSRKQLCFIELYQSTDYSCHVAVCELVQHKHKMGTVSSDKRDCDSLF